MSLKNYYPKIVRVIQDANVMLYDDEDSEITSNVGSGEIGVALTEFDDGRLLVALSEDRFSDIEVNRFLIPSDNLVTLDPNEISRYGEPIQSILDQIGEEGSDDTDPIEMLSTLVPIGSFLWFEGTEVPEEDGPAVTVEGEGIAEVWGDFIDDPETGEMKVEVFVRPLTFEGTDEGTPEVRVIDPSKVYVLTKAAR